jgi:predicted nucleotidyltransferase
MEKIEAFCRKWKVQRMWLFGSALRDDFGPESDVDVLVEFAPKLDGTCWTWQVRNRS